VKGHKQVVAARERGWKPVAVFLTIGSAPAARYAFQEPEQALSEGAIPEVFTELDAPTLADLRWLRGMRVHLTIGDGPRHAFWQWWAALEAVEAAHIIGIEPDGEVVEWLA
jgi:hypothetical protein